MRYYINKLVTIQFKVYFNERYAFLDDAWSPAADESMQYISFRFSFHYAIMFK